MNVSMNFCKTRREVSMINTSKACRLTGLHLQSKAGLYLNHRIELIYSNINYVFYTKEFKSQLDSMRGKKCRNKISKWIYRLKDRFPGNPGMWERIKGCKNMAVYELKPEPYRVAVLIVGGRFCLCLQLWRVDKKAGERRERR